jgi:hypothetical protein
VTLYGLTVKLDFTSALSTTVSFDLYSTSGGLPTGTGTPLWSYTSTSAGIRNVTAPLLNTPALAANTEYAIVMMNPATSVKWEAVTSSTYPSSGGTATMDGNVYYHATAWQTYSAGTYMQLDVVPEVPATGIVAGFGALAIGMGHAWRSKKNAAKAV